MRRSTLFFRATLILACLTLTLVAQAQYRASIQGVVSRRWSNGHSD
jgi:hypothetical protein